LRDEAARQIRENEVTAEEVERVLGYRRTHFGNFRIFRACAALSPAIINGTPITRRGSQTTERTHTRIPSGSPNTTPITAATSGRRCESAAWSVTSIIAAIPR